MHAEQCHGIGQPPAQQEPILLRERVWKAGAFSVCTLFFALLCLFRPEWIQIGSTASFLILICLWDWRWYRVPNLFTYPVMAVGVLYHTLTAGWGGLLHSLEGLLLGGALLLLGYLFKVAGAGDVKALAALGAWWGPQSVFEIFLVTALLGGVIAFVVLAAKGKLADTVQRYCLMGKILLWTRKFHYVEPSLVEGRTQLPYGAVISCGAVLWFMMENFSR